MAWMAALVVGCGSGNTVFPAGSGPDGSPSDAQPTTGDSGIQSTSPDSSGGVMPEEDAGADSATQPDAHVDSGASAAFACGQTGLKCDPVTEFCTISMVMVRLPNGQIVDQVGTCADYPAACGSPPTCGCVQGAVSCQSGAPTCTVQGSEVVLVCSPSRHGV